jgi:hypothetical protein
MSPRTVLESVPLCDERSLCNSVVELIVRGAMAL